MADPTFPHSSAMNAGFENTEWADSFNPVSWEEVILTGPIVSKGTTVVHLTNVERRLAKLEAAFTNLLPNVEIESVLSSSSELSPPIQLPVSKDGAPQSKRVKVTAERRDSDLSSDLPLETLPQEADGFDWAEKEAAFDDLADGMAALSIKPEGTGYLGASSAVVLLRFLLFCRWDINIPPQPREDHTSSQPPEQLAPLSIIQMPDSAASRQVTSSLIDAYFRSYHTTYPFIHEPTFRAQYNELIKRPEKHAWHMLLNSVLALGAWTTGNENSNLDDAFYREARRYSEDESIFESGSIAMVQALLLLSNYAQKRNRPNTGWNYLGLAVRMAVSLGLHREFPDWNISLLQKEMRRRVWWGLFIFDSGASTTFGRPILLPDSDIVDVEHVLNIPDELLTPATKIVPHEVSEPTLYSSLIAQSTFHLSTNSISNRLLAIHPLTASETLTLDKSIDSWNANLPWYFQPSVPSPSANEWFTLARYRLQWRAWNLRIILTRPIVLSWVMQRIGLGHRSLEDHEDDNQPEHKQCRELCLRSARNTITSIQEYISSYETMSRLGGWYTLFFLFQASLIPLIFLLTIPTDPAAPEWLDDIKTVKALLMQVSPKNGLARRCLEIISRLSVTQPFNAAEDSGTLSGVGETDLFGDIYSLWSASGSDPISLMSWPDLEQPEFREE
ncbi:MAG: lactose regulatory protein lac9 and GAL4-like protein [Cirrosporium novae-zelandiae]|nr:MAG: lactose regulatory protein lac9 and GAL4-like protein [Cirrosporium novae-zelandiae]